MVFSSPLCRIFQKFEISDYFEARNFTNLQSFECQSSIIEERSQSKGLRHSIARANKKERLASLNTVSSLFPSHRVVDCSPLRNSRRPRSTFQFFLLRANDSFQSRRRKQRNGRQARGEPTVSRVPTSRGARGQRERVGPGPGVVPRANICLINQLSPSLAHGGRVTRDAPARIILCRPEEDRFLVTLVDGLFGNNFSREINPTLSLNARTTEHFTLNLSGGSNRPISGLLFCKHFNLEGAFAKAFQ